MRVRAKILEPRQSVTVGRLAKIVVKPPWIVSSPSLPSTAPPLPIFVALHWIISARKPPLSEAEVWGQEEEEDLMDLCHPNPRCRSEPPPPAKNALHHSYKLPISAYKHHNPIWNWNVLPDLDRMCKMAVSLQKLCIHCGRNMFDRPEMFLASSVKPIGAT